MGVFDYEPNDTWWNQENGSADPQNTEFEKQTKWNNADNYVRERYFWRRWNLISYYARLIKWKLAIPQSIAVIYLSFFVSETATGRVL